MPTSSNEVPTRPAPSGRRWGSILLRAAAILLALGAIQVGTWWARSSSALVAAVERWVPENVHYENGKHFAFVCFEWAQCEGWTTAELDAIEALLRDRYATVYTDRVQIPKERIVFVDDGVTWAGIADGFLFSVDVKERGWFHAQIEHSDWEGMRAAYWGRRSLYWLLFGWVSRETRGAIA